jgi:transposase
MRVMYERVAGIDVHKNMIKVGIRTPGHRAWTRTSEVQEYRTFYGVLQTMAAGLRQRGVTHVVMEASGVYTEPVYYALAERGFEQVAVINPAHAKALKGHKTDAKDALRLAELFECGLLRGSYIPTQALKDLRDLTRYRTKTVQAPHLGDPAAGQGAGVGGDQARLRGRRPDRQVRDIDDRGADRRGAARAGAGRPGDRPDAHRRQAGRPVPGAGGPVHRSPRGAVPAAPGPYRAVQHGGRRPGGQDRRQGRPIPAGAELLKSVDGFGDAVACAWLAEIGPVPHEYFASHDKLASWVTLCPGNHMSAGKRKHGHTGDAGTYIKPMLVQAAWSAIKTQGRLQAKYHKLVRRFGGPKNRAAVKKAILAIAHTLLKIAYQVLKSGKPYQDLGADFYTKRESPEQRRAYLLRQLEKLSPGCTITITPRTEAA